MNTFFLGSGSEYIKVTFPTSYSGEGWCEVTVELAVRGFHGTINPSVEAFDFESFANQLRKLYDSLQGKAEFKPREEQFTLSLTASTQGHIEAKGVAWSEATCGNCLNFALDLDQSFLEEPLKELEELVRVWAK
jgi:hypothetical protein